MTLNLVTTGDLVFSKDHFSIYNITSLGLVILCDLVTVFDETKSVTKLRLLTYSLAIQKKIQYNSTKTWSQ